MTTKTLPTHGSCRVLFTERHDDAINVDVVITEAAGVPAGTAYGIDLALPSVWWVQLSIEELLRRWSVSGQVLRIDARLEPEQPPTVSIGDGTSVIRLLALSPV